MASTTPDKGRRILRPGLVVFLLALAFRLVLFQAGHWEPNIIDDYDFISHSIVEGKGFSFDGQNPTISRGPIYPAYIAAVMLATRQEDTPFSLLRLIDSVLDSLTALAVFFLARAWFPALGARAHVAAGLAYALNPFAAFFTVKLGAEAHQTLIFALYLLLLHRALADDAHGIRHTILLGLAGGLLLLSKSVFFPVVAGLPAVFLLSRRFRTRSAAVRLASAVIIAFALLAPWSVRNYRVSGRPVPLQTLAGYNFWFDFTQDSNRKAAIASGNLNHVYQGGDVALPDGRAYRPYSFAAADDASTDAYLCGKAVQWARQHPGGMIAKMLDNFFGFWYIVETPKKMIIAAAFSLALLALALGGCIKASRSAPIEARVFFVLPFVFAAIYSPALGVFRYSLLMYPLLSVLAGISLAHIASALLRR